MQAKTKSLWSVALIALEVDLVELAFGQLARAPPLLAGTESGQGRIALREKLEQRLARHDGVQVAQDLTHCDSRIAFLEPIGRVARQAGAQRRLILLDASGDSQPRKGR